MRRALSLVLTGCLICGGSSALAGVATSEGAYSLASNSGSVVEWIANHRDKFYRAANAEIVEARGSNRYLVRSNSPIGSSTYVVEERLTEENGQTTYRIALVERVSGRVADMRATVIISPSNQGSQVSMTTTIDFDHVLATSWAVKRVTDKSITQTRELLVRHVEH